MESMQAISSAKSRFAAPPDSDPRNSDRARRIRRQTSDIGLVSVSIIRAISITG